MNFKLFVLALALVTLGSCAAPKPPPRQYVITDVIPAGSSVEFFAELPTNKWRQTMCMNSLHNPMPIHVAEKWALSAAQQRVGSHWRDYCFRVTPPLDSTGLPAGPVVVWQRHHSVNH